MAKTKVLKKDFTASDLPKTRKEVFKDVLKLRFSVFVKLCKVYKLLI